MLTPAKQLAALLSTAVALLDGTAAAGTTGKAADAGHVHPSDTSRLAAANNLSDLANVATALTNLGFGVSLKPNGYLKVPVAGAFVIVQWGQVSLSNDASVSLPTTFPNICAAAFANYVGSDGSSAASTDSLGQSSIVIRPRQITNGGAVGAVSGATTFAFLAIGY